MEEADASFRRRDAVSLVLAVRELAGAGAREQREVALRVLEAGVVRAVRDERCWSQQLLPASLQVTLTNGEAQRRADEHVLPVVAVVLCARDGDHGSKEEGTERKPRAVAVAVRVPEVHLACEVEREEAEAGKRQRRVAARERLEAIVEAQLVGRCADLDCAEAENGAVDRARAGNAARDQVRTGTADHHL